MELSEIPTHHQHRQGRHSKHQSRQREPRVVHTPRALGSDHRGSLSLWPTRDEHVRDDNKQSLVDNWLEDIETPRLQRSHNNKSLPKEPSSKAHSRPESAYRLRGPSPSRVFSHNSHNGQVSKASHRNSRRAHKRPRELAQDDSDIDHCGEQEAVRVRPEIPQIIRSVSATAESNFESGIKRSHMGSEGSVGSVISGVQYHFVKKPRHKTRSDRYDTRRAHEPPKAEKKKKKKKRREKLGNQRKTNESRRAGDFSSAREVMDKFTSKSILSDRITMQPAVRTGLFDNGRESNNQLPDLTFHEMHYLKRPPAPKPVPRGRERAKRRGERELEEVSAFFLHKGIPEAAGVSGRDQPTFSGASSLDGVTHDSSASSIDAPSHQPRSGDDDGHKSPGIDRESSRRGTCWTWSSSYEPLEREISQASGAREHTPAQGSTPSRARNALERTGIFENTGISCVKRPKQVPSATSRAKSRSINREPLAVASADIDNRQSGTSRQNVRIVRYHDRGVMTSEEAENAAGQKATGTRQVAIEQPRGKTPPKIRAFARSDKYSQSSHEDEKYSRHQGEGDVFIAAHFNAADHDPELDRPRSPKRSLVERLEAAADHLQSQKLQNDLARGANFFPVQRDAPFHYNHPILRDYSASQHGSLETKPDSVRDRKLGLSEIFQGNNHLDTIAGGLRDSQRAHEFNLNSQIDLMPTGSVSNRISNIEQPELDVQVASNAHRGSSGAHPLARYTQENYSNVQMIPPNSDTASQSVMNDWAATGHGQLGCNQRCSGAPSLLLEAADLSPQRSDRQHSLAEYIAKIENDVFRRPQGDNIDGASPVSGWHGLRDNDAASPECAAQAHQSCVDAYDRDLLEEGLLENRSIGGSHHGGGEVMYNSDIDQDEQKFMSTFWRPNYH